MKMTRLEVNEANIVAMVNNPRKGVIEVMDDVATHIVHQVVLNLNEPYNPDSTNRPPGPPRRRTGNLQESIHQTGPLIRDGLIELVVVTDVQNPRGIKYGQKLLDDGYVFVPPGLIPQ